jgi:hypothetical protein
VTYSNIGLLQLVGTAGDANYQVPSTSVPTNIYGTLDGIDVFTVGTGDLGQLNGKLSVTGSSDSSLFVNDGNANFTGAYTITGSSITRPGSAGVSFSGMRTVALLGASGATAYNAANAQGNISVFAGNGNLSANTKALTVNGPVSLFLDDHLNTKPTAYVITPTTVTDDTGFGGLTYSHLQSLDVIGANANETFTINSTSTGTTLDGHAGLINHFYLNSESNPVTMDVGPNSDNTFYVGNGDLGQLTAPVTINGGGSAGTFLEDKNGSFDGGYVITAFSVTRPGFGGLTYSNSAIVLVGAAAQTRYYDVRGDSSNLIIWGNSGRNIYSLDGNLNLGSLPKPVTIYGGVGGTSQNIVQLLLPVGVSPGDLTVTSIVGGQYVAAPEGFGGLDFFNCVFFPAVTLH